MRKIVYVAGLGDSRIIKRFLYFPKQIGQDWRWWETVYIRQIYRARDPFCESQSNWEDQEFVDDPNVKVGITTVTADY